jgi:nucleotide-binding universal stress UspA family protein
MFKTILVPVDIDDLEVARSAVEKAVALAQSSGAALRLMNVELVLPASYMDYVPETFDVDRKAEIETKLRTIAGKLDLPPERVSWTSRKGGVYTEILAEAEAWGADLIVLGSHRPSMATYLLGSNAKTVARHAKCSVLIVRD